MKLNALKLALAAALVSALSMALLTLYALYLGRGVALVRLLGPVFPGYSMSLTGTGIGALYGLLIGFVYVGVLALVYNKMLDLKAPKKAAKKPAKKKK